ncbi:MAG: hypothetical protein ACPG7K_03565 [Poseidonia sp.]
MSSPSKRDLGQYFTEDPVWLRPHLKAHLDALKSTYASCLDPFAGDGHLLALAEEAGFQVHGYDIDATHCQRRDWGKPHDSIRRVPQHENTFVLTNPPYMAKNSAKRMKSSMVDYFRPGSVPGIGEKQLNVLDDLFKLAIERTIAVYGDSIWIVPESGIQDLERLPHWKNNLHSLTILESNPFKDTEHPVCVMVFSSSNPAQEVWKNDTLLGTYDQLREVHLEALNAPRAAISMQFNAPQGNLGYRAVDGTKGDDSMRVKFCRADELGYDRKGIKVSSRHMTYIDVPLSGQDLDRTIEEANAIIEAYRAATHDVFLTAFMGNTKRGQRRRRLDYKLARRMFNAAFLTRKDRQ